MKRKSIILVAVLVLLQLCSSLWAMPTTAYEAEMIVTGWLETNSQPLGATLGREVIRVETFTDDYGEPVYYVVYLHPSGFVIVSADDLVEPIIGFADDGTYDPSLENPLGALVTNDLNGRIAAARRTFSLFATVQNATVTESQFKWNYLISIAGASEGRFSLMGPHSIPDVRVAPLVQSRWGQTEECVKNCYNYYTPNNYPCGCVATVMAQLMRYHQYPIEPNDYDPNQPDGRRKFTVTVDGNDVTLYIRGGDGNGGPYEWEQMVLNPSCSTTLEQRQAIGALCYDAGIAVKMQYYEGGSGAYIHDIINALRETFNYSSAINARNNGNNIQREHLEDMVNSNLDAGYPVLLSIIKKGADGGHAVLADGYGYDFLTPYHHLNMGWRSNDYAWYNLPTVEIDPFSFNVVCECVYNISKKSDNGEEIKGEIISGRVTDASGKPVSGAIVTATGLSDGDIHEDETDSKGIYALVGVNSDSTYNVSVTKQTYNFTSADIVTGTSIDNEPVSGNRWGIDFRAAFSFDISSCAVEDFESRDFNKFQWEHYGDYSWDITKTDKHTGTCSAEADIPWQDKDSEGATATLRLTLDCLSGNISFHFKVETGQGDYFIFYIDGEEKGRWDFEEEWTEVSFPVTEGKRTFQWTYSKVSRRSDDGVWIDDIIFPIDYSSCPAPTWSNQDIGSPVAAGNASYDNATETWTVQGGGHDIAGNSDAFHYVYKPLLGDGEIITRVVSIENTDPSAKAGVMIRESLNPDSKHAQLVITPGNGCKFQLRRNTGLDSETDDAVTELWPIRPPHWLRLARSGNKFRAYHSYDGKIWSELVWSPQTIPMEPDVYIGLVVTSHVDDALCTAVFYNGQIKAYDPSSDDNCAIENFETGDFSKFPWKHYGEYYWDIARTGKHTGSYGVEIGTRRWSLPYGANGTMQVTLDCISGNVSFYHKVRLSYLNEYLIFYIDGEEKGRWSGQEDWAEVSFPVTAGRRTFEWTYSQLGSTRSGYGAWIDDIVFPVDCNSETSSP